ncbi:uncharacterized protein LOC135465928 [Liolophura sinensis]|uniref:uncharacterized protein LOC135465928 n=1 Tax=Liolophura sinensis TaxID=3198878 RepID=UPI0031585FF7
MECQERCLPVNLFHSALTYPCEPILARETNLLCRLSKLQPFQPERVRELQDFYKYQTALVETERYRSLMLGDAHPHLKVLLNQYYDQELGLIIKRVEASVALLEDSGIGSCLSREAQVVASNISRRHLGLRTRSLLSKASVRLLELWYEQHIDHPYPTPSETESLATACGLTQEQVKKWFANKRNRSANTRSLTQIASVKRKRSMMM